MELLSFNLELARWRRGEEETGAGGGALPAVNKHNDGMNVYAGVRKGSAAEKSTSKEQEPRK